MMNLHASFESCLCHKCKIQLSPSSSSWSSNVLDFCGVIDVIFKSILMMRILMNTNTRTDIFTYIFALRCKDWVCGIQFKVLLSHYLTTNSCAQKIVTCHTQVVFWLVTVLKRRRILCIWICLKDTGIFFVNILNWYDLRIVICFLFIYRFQF